MSSRSGAMFTSTPDDVHLEAHELSAHFAAAAVQRRSAGCRIDQMYLAAGEALHRMKCVGLSCRAVIGDPALYVLAGRRALVDEGEHRGRVVRRRRPSIKENPLVARC